MTKRDQRLIATYTLVHGLVEFLTGLTLFSMLSTWSDRGVLLVTYSALAFGIPLLVAMLAFNRRLGGLTEGQIGLAGSIFLATGMLVGHFPWACVALLGLGSALIHIAAGTATLKLGRNKGLAVGVFESTGALGLAGGTVLGSTSWEVIGETPWVALGVLIAIASGLAILAWGTNRDHLGLAALAEPTQGDRNPPGGLTRALPSGEHPPAWLLGIVLAALTVISILRAFTGLAAPQPWKQGTGLVMLAAVMVMLGRAVGGVLTDRFGFRVTALIGFLGAALGLGLWPDAAWAGLAGLFFLACTMAPIIVALVSTTGRPSVAFGLAQFFQVPSAFLVGLLYRSWIVIILMLICAMLVVVAKPLLERKVDAPI